jgi:hypothetical protein
MYMLLIPSKSELLAQLKSWTGFKIVIKWTDNGIFLYKFIDQYANISWWYTL